MSKGCSFHSDQQMAADSCRAKRDGVGSKCALRRVLPVSWRRLDRRALWDGRNTFKRCLRRERGRSPLRAGGGQRGDAPGMSRRRQKNQRRWASPGGGGRVQRGCVHGRGGGVWGKSRGTLRRSERLWGAVGSAPWGNRR